MIKTPSSRTHYYFISRTENSDLNHVIKQVCYTRSKLGGVGIDIRNNKDNVVAPPSSIDGRRYERIKDMDMRYTFVIGRLSSRTLIKQFIKTTNGINKALF